MHINVYGNPDDPKVILLAPMMVSGEDLYELMHPYFRGDYFFIAPDQGGHGKAGAYISADEEYSELKAYLMANGYTQISLLYGASLGVAVAYRLFMDPDLTVGKAWFDGVALSRNAAVMEAIMRNMFRKRKKMLEETHVEASQSLVEMYGYDFAKMMTSNFERITLSDVDNICYACCHYDLKPLTQSQQSKLHLEYGEKDFDLGLSKKAIKTYMPLVKPVIREGYGHCGYILPPDPGDIVLCGQIAENCDAEVWFPIYPMAPDHKLVETLQSTLKVYQEILKVFPAEQVRFFGTSSGGGQALSLCMYIKHEKLDVPLPAKLVLQSPGLQVPPSESQKAEMEKRAKADVMIPPGFFDEIAPVLATGADAYLLSPILFDMTGFPPIDIFYGTREVMIAYLKDMKAACAKCGVPLHVHIGRGMMHCWGAMEFVPEAQAVRQEYFEALR